ncbi:C40 family peptidase [Cohnella luojiensis]|uniref:NlpC/P60 family protein n=1 Tax=Cohnella luojiensis TaxID=652876 RepID=A0A4Y8LW62_9BACL|nr:C40 family peptidase [Cohnella luojiensis]TFE26094.1 NlpC/P60 family protein [Cohnella luojiensis]
MRKASVFLFSLAVLLAFQVGSAFADSKLDQTVDKLIGIDYDYGGTTTSGFDCSGFTGYVFKKLGINLPRSSRDMFSWDQGKKVDRDDLRAGDLVFFNTSGNGVSHVGIYVGNNKFAHAASKGVTITSMSESYYVKRYLGARRIMDTATYEKVATEQEAVEVAVK